MKERHKSIILYSIAIVFFLTLFLLIINSLLRKEYYAFFWYCYFAIAVMIFGLIKRNPNIILSQAIILAIPDFLWIFDFFYLIFTGHTLFGIAKNFISNSLLEKITSLQHIYIIPLSLVALSIIKLKKNYKILLVSLAEIVLFFLMTFFLIPNTQNVNCVHLNCIDIPLTFLPYYLIWFMFAFGFVIISYLIITSLPFIKKK